MTQRDREAVSIDITQPLEKITGPSKGRVTRTNWNATPGAEARKERQERYTMDQKRIEEEIRNRDPLNIRLNAMETVITNLMLKVEAIEAKVNE